MPRPIFDSKRSRTTQIRRASFTRHPGAGRGPEPRYPLEPQRHTKALKRERLSRKPCSRLWAPAYAGVTMRGRKRAVIVLSPYLKPSALLFRAVMGLRRGDDEGVQMFGDNPASIPEATRPFIPDSSGISPTPSHFHPRNPLGRPPGWAQTPRRCLLPPALGKATALLPVVSRLCRSCKGSRWRSSF
jgi:hypothetical protein